MVGANLVRSLVDGGARVRAVDVARGASLDGLDVEHLEADVLDPEALSRAFDGVEAVFHLAAVISVTGDPTGHVWKVNVEGPRNAARAALGCGVRRFVHCSSVHAFDLEKCGPSLDEQGPRAVGDHAPVYDRSKYAGEQGVRSVIEDGLDAVIVNPTGVIGPHDHGPSRMGETICRFRDGAIPVNVGGGFDFVDVRDLVAGMLAAVERGRTGANYLLSGTRISIKELGRLVANHCGSRVPRFDVPLSVVEPLGPLVLRFTPADQIALFTPDSLHALRYSPSVSHFAATTELGYAARPIHRTVEDTLDWFAEVGR
jgi:dihydroflavonol-4-reductase